MLKNLIKKNKCTGCASCKQVCPSNAIQLKISEEEYYGITSFYDTEKCISCNKCREVCPVCNKIDNKNAAIPECYAVIASDKIRNRSTSGGAFTLLAKVIFSMGGAVCGVSFDKDMHAHHVVIKHEAELDLLRHSKYVQADCEEIYVEIEKVASEGPILIIGTPCQIAGMRKCFSLPEHSSNYEHIFFVDLYCGHAPGNSIFESYLNNNFCKNEIESYTFRTKQRGWVADAATVLFNNGHVKTLDNSNDCYQLAYHSHLTTRKVCEECEFAGNPRQGDLTIADYWWINESNPELDDHFGTSCVLVNNEKGKKLFEKITASVSLFIDEKRDNQSSNETTDSVGLQCTNEQQSISSDDQVRNGVQQNVNLSEDIKIIQKLPFSTMKKNRPEYYPANSARDRFYNIQKRFGFNEAVHRCLHPYFDVILWGNWSEKNYGSELTYFALYHILTNMGKEVLLVERPKEASWGPNEKPVLFRDNPYPTYYTYVPATKTDMRRINDWSDTFMVGSDQIWHHDLYEPFGRVAFLDYIYPSKKKIAYASSFGREYWNGTDYERQITALMVKEFDAVSVREKSGVDICKSLFDCDAEHVLDPIFLCDRGILKNLAGTAKQHEQFIGVYMLDVTKEKLEVIRAVEKNTGLRVRIITDAFLNYNLGNDVLNLNEREELIGDTSVEEWVENFADADYVITDSFHGTCLSIIFEKQFISIANEGRGSIRIYDLLSQFGISERVVNENDINQDFVCKIVSKKIDYKEVNKILENRRYFSITWLSNALDKKKEVQVSEEERLRRQIDELEYKIEQVQNENQKILDWHTKRLDHHDEILDWHTKRLDHHDEILDWHTKRLDHHDEIQEWHTGRLDYYDKIQNWHTERLDNLEHIKELQVRKDGRQSDKLKSALTNRFRKK
ncbi:MAG: polysaccharide pyruvyl transferase family protein [Eubacterium sp.]|nr:polysaccharide pyruvyl transferase family protein [Eubacterium sp.]